MRSEVVRLFQTLPHPCGYFDERTAQNLVIDPAAPQLPQIYDAAMQRGYRRAGGHVYYPQCQGCRACVACRVPVARFRPDRSQRRCLARNADLAVRIAPAAYTDEYFALYQRYLHARHRDGGMDDARPDDFARFLYTVWSPTRFIEFRRGDHLLGLAVTDFCPSGLSAVYTFFDPDETARGLGTFAILSQIRLAHERGLPHVYLGFWIEGHPKMHYKARYRPLEVLRDGGWHEL
ncbi:MAG: arginyltransferase [Rhodanobacteraceae bacterium]|jgi:arginine-tRNA-protein transferase|nr:arginyltransferase [Rhodanobacteraceae bacterium]